MVFKNNNLKAFLLSLLSMPKKTIGENYFFFSSLSLTVRFLALKREVYRQAREGEAGHKEIKSIVIVRQSLSYHKFYFQDLKGGSILKHFGSQCSDS